MKKIAVLIVLLTSIFLTAMSNSPKEEPNKSEMLVSQVEIQTGVGFITQKELYNIAVNYYKYYFEEEHEWKGIRVDSKESVIKNITPVTDGKIIFAYMIDYNPDGHILLNANKNLGGLINRCGSGLWGINPSEKSIRIDDKRINFITQDWLKRIKKAYEAGDILTKAADHEFWNKLNVPQETFNLKADFDNSIPQPDWWIEKKKLKNTEGMIKTEWHQKYPFYIDCPPASNGDSSLVGCVPLAMAQLMKHYSYPVNGLYDFSSITYDWANMLAYDSLMVTTTQRNAVSRICRDAGISVNAEYDSLTGTGALLSSTSYALSKYFNYTAQLPANAGSYSYPEGWVDSLKMSLVRSQPVLYGGYFTNSEFSGYHNWIVNGYQDVGQEQFHFNVGLETYRDNDFYDLTNLIPSHDAVFYAIPDMPSNALSLPYKETFENVPAGTGIHQIPKNIGVSHTLNGTNMTFFTAITNQETQEKALWVGNSGDLDQWFVIKKINLACDSVPVLKFSYYIYDQSGLTSGSDAIIVEASNDNRITWNQIYKLDNGNYKTSNFNKFIENIVSLNNYKNQIINIRFRLPYSGSTCFCFLDDIEIGLLELSFPELTDNMTLSPKTAQSVKVSPSIYTPPKSKGFEEFDMIMDFYVKEDIEEADYALTFSDSVLENGVFEYPDLNTDDYIGKDIKVRAVARTKSSSLTLKSAEISLKISGRECHVDLPLPATESWFDFETRLNFELSILAEPSFADSLDNVYIGFDVYDDYNTETNGFPISIFEWYYPEYFAIDSTVYFFEIEEKAKSISAERKVIELDDLQKIKNAKPTRRFFPVDENMIKNVSKDLTSYFALSYRYPHSLDLCPGSYTVYMMAIRKDIYDNYGLISEIAKSDSSQFIIPQWKMKLRRDYWFADTEVPYKQNLEYEAGKTMDILFWLPYPLPPFEPLYLDIVRETDNAVVENFTLDFDDKASGGVMVQWDIPSVTVPGFYNLKASNVDYWTDIQVDQQIDPQVCPLYLSWENSGDWPTNWPGSDSWDWEIHPALAWSPAHGAYALGAKYSTEGNTGNVSIQKSVSINSEWDRVLEFAIGLEKGEGTTNFDPLLADYSIATSKDGANWVIEKTANVSDYTSVSWSYDPAHCFMKTFKPLGQVTNFGIKFIKDGIVTSPPDSQIVLFDEVKVDFIKEPLKSGPTDPSAQYAGGNVNVGWSGAVKSEKALDNYYVYRNGIKIGETTAESYVDSTVYANRFYNYAITAHYDDGSTYPESPMNECSVSIYTGLYSPSNLVITNENPDIKLTWSAVTGASEYKVYSSDDPYGTFAEDTTGTFDGEEWTAPISTSKLFYYVVAVNESMKEKKIIKEETLSRVK